MKKEKKLKSARIPKVVKRTQKMTKAGIKSCDNVQRTMALSILAGTRSTRIEEVGKVMGIRGTKEMSEITQTPSGKMGRINRSNSCPSTKDCLRMTERCFNNPNRLMTDEVKKIEIEKKRLEDDIKRLDEELRRFNRCLASPRFLIGAKNTSPPQIVNDMDENGNKIELHKILSEMLFQYSDAVTPKIQGLIDRNNAGAERQDKQFLSFSCIIDLYQSHDRNARIAYPMDPHSGIYSGNIVGYIEATNTAEIDALQGQACVVISDDKSPAVIREIFPLGDHILFSALDGRAGSFILSRNSPGLRIGRIGLYMSTDQFARDLMSNTQRDIIMDAASEEDQERKIMVINNPRRMTK